MAECYLLFYSLLPFQNIGHLFPEDISVSQKVWFIIFKFWWNCLLGNNQSGFIISEDSPLTIPSNCSIDTVVQLIRYSGDTTKKFLHLFCNFALSIKLLTVKTKRRSFLETSTFQRIRGDTFQYYLIAVFWHFDFNSSIKHIDISENPKRSIETLLISCNSFGLRRNGKYFWTNNE